MSPNKDTQSDTTNDQDARTTDTKEHTLDSAIPPVEIKRETPETVKSEPDDKSSQPRGRVSQITEKWGPWRRFKWYLATQRAERQEFWQERDPEKNERGQLPPGESVQLPAIWVAELYTPSSVDGLLRGISNLDWEHGRSRDDSLLKWMSDIRRGCHAGWINLGPISNPSDSYFMKERTAVLPNGVRAALPRLMSITPSITALIMAFILDDQAAASLDEPLRAEYTTRTERSHLFRQRDLLNHLIFGTSVRLGRSILDPNLQRRNAARNCLAELENSCIQWVGQNLPGIFASGIRSGMFPTALLLVTEVAAPATEEAQSIRAFDGLAINRDYDAWESEEWPGARLVLPSSWNEEGIRLTFACRRRDAFPEQPGYHDPESNWTITQRADGRIRGLLSRWALSCMLDGYHETLSELRDSLASTRTHRPVKDLKTLRLLARTKLFDIIGSSHEIEEFTNDMREYRYDVLEMNYTQPLTPEGTNLIDALSTEQRHRSEQARRDAKLLQEIMNVTVGASQAIANIGIQWLAIVLSILSIVIALVALFASTGNP